MIEKKKVRKGLQILFSIFVISSFLVILFSLKKESFVYIRKIKLFYLFLSFLSGVLYAIFASLTFVSASLSFNKRIPFWFAFEILLSGYFLASTTPFGSGGLPYQLFLLSRKNIKPGEGSFALYVFGFLKYLYLFIFLIFSLKYLEIPKNPYVKASIFYILFLLILMIVIVLILLFIPSNYLKKFSSKFKGRFLKVISFLIDEIIRFKKIIPLFFKNLKSIILSLIFAFLSFLFLLLIIPFLYFGLSLTENFFKIFALSSLIYFLVLFSPSPGAIGVAEGVSALILSKYVPVYLLPFLIFIWRFFSFYLLAFTGGFFILWRISKWKF